MKLSKILLLSLILISTNVFAFSNHHRSGTPSPEDRSIRGAVIIPSIENPNTVTDSTVEMQKDGKDADLGSYNSPTAFGRSSYSADPRSNIESN